MKPTTIIMSSDKDEKMGVGMQLQLSITILKNPTRQQKIRVYDMLRQVRIKFDWDLKGYLRALSDG